MGSTFCSVHYHVVFSTKDRRPFIQAAWRTPLYEYLGGTLRGLGVVPECIGGIEDHVHLLISTRTTDAPAVFVRELKKASSIWVAAQHEPTFAWQDGYAVFSVSWTHESALRRYIDSQAAHHRGISFADELQRLLAKNGVVCDPEPHG